MGVTMKTRWSITVGSLVFLLSCSSGMKSPPLPDEIEVIRDITLTENARIPENDPAYTGVEIFDTRLVYSYSSAPTIELEPGHVVVGGAEMGYLRHVRSVGAFQNGQLEVTTEDAYITDLIADGAFRIRTHPEASAWMEWDGIVSGRQSALETKLSVFSSGTDWGLTCGGGISADITPIFDIDLDLEIEMDLRRDTLDLLPHVHSALFAISGQIDVGIQLKSAVALSESCTLNVIELLRNRLGNPNAFKLRLPTIQGAIGVIPIRVTHSIEPVFEIEGTLQADVGPLEMTATVGFGLRSGIEKIDNGDWQLIWEPSRRGSVDLMAPDSIGRISASAQAAAGLQYSAFLWGLVGPSFALRKTTTGAVSLNPDTCEWRATVNAGSDFVTGVHIQIPVVETEIASIMTTATLSDAQIASTEGTFDFLCMADAGVADAGVTDASSGDASFFDAATPDAVGWIDAIAPPVDTALYYVDDSELRKMNLDGSGTSVVAAGITHSPVGGQVAIDPVAGKVYWTSATGISRANYDGSGAEVVLGVTAWDVAIDVVSGKIYWTDLFEQKIRRSNLDATDVEVVASTGTEPDSITVDPVSGKVYWSETINAGTEIEIYSADLTGGNIQTVITRPSPNQAWLAVDPPNGKLYWAESNQGGYVVTRANVDGSGEQTVADNLNRDPWGLGVDSSGGHVYWTEWGTGNTGEVLRTSLSGGAPQTVVSGLTYPLGVAIGPAN
jgi:hypothetical protein